MDNKSYVSLSCYVEKVSMTVSLLTGAYLALLTYQILRVLSLKPAAKNDLCPLLPPAASPLPSTGGKFEATEKHSVPSNVFVNCTFISF